MISAMINAATSSIQATPQPVIPPPPFGFIYGVPVDPKEAHFLPNAAGYPVLKAIKELDELWKVPALKSLR